MDLLGAAYSDSDGDDDDSSAPQQPAAGAVSQTLFSSSFSLSMGLLKR